MFSGFNWQTPEWLVLAGLPLVVWLARFWWAQKRQMDYADAALWPWVKAQSSTLKTEKRLESHQAWWFLRRFGDSFFSILTQRPFFWLMMAWLAFVVALANPRTQLDVSGQSSLAEGVDILMALDLSRSMLAQDVHPNRFLQARALMESFSRRLPEQDRLGLIVFAGQAHNVLPLSFDRELFRYYLQYIAPNQLPLRGSDWFKGLMTSEQHLAQTAGESRVLLVWTDGGEISQQAFSPEVTSRLTTLANSGLKVVLIGVGENQAVRVPDSSHASGVLHARGQLVTSQLDESGLKQLARTLGATYLHASEDLSFMDSLLQAVAASAGQRPKENQRQSWQSWAWPFVWLGMFALLWAFYPWRLGAKT